MNSFTGNFELFPIEMKRNVLYLTGILAIAVAVTLFFLLRQHDPVFTEDLRITYPWNQAVFPADIAPPVVTWEDPDKESREWHVSVSVNDAELTGNIKTTSREWSPSPAEWQKMVEQSRGKKMIIKVRGADKRVLSADSVGIIISEDEVEAPIFYRAVPLPFKFARENLKKVSWHLGSVSQSTKPHAVLDNIPVCANCHSFTPDGATLAMDVDARDEKGAYAITSMKEDILLSEDSIINWEDYNKGAFTYGLLSRISPDGRYVVSTLRDCEIFTDRNDMEYSQLFFPFKGILVVYDRIKKTFTELEGANDTMLVQSNPCWSPDGKFIYFTRAKAKHYEESGIHSGSSPTLEDSPRYRKFEKSYLDRDSLIKFNIYKIPFNQGKGGKAIPVPGASHNGFSNYFPKISPDGKWMVFCRAESFMLLQKDSKLFIMPAEGGEPHLMSCNTDNMNSWHSWSPNSKWLVFATKALSPYTQLFLTHVDDNGMDAPPVYLHNFSFKEHANNIPEFVNIRYNKNIKIDPSFLSEKDFLVRNGEIKQREGDFNGAFEAFDKAVKMFPGKSEPYYKRSMIYIQKGQYNLALSDLNKAISIEKLPNYYTRRGLVYMDVGATPKAVRDLLFALELDPKSFQPLAYLGIAYSKQKKFEKAIHTFEKAIDLYDKDPVTWFHLGLACFYNQDFQKANQAFSVSIDLDPGDSRQFPVYEMRGKTRLKLGDKQGAAQDFTAALQINPNNQEAKNLLDQTKKAL